jgi:hypothetical protein
MVARSLRFHLAAIVQNLKTLANYVWRHRRTSKLLRVSHKRGVACRGEQPRETKPSKAAIADAVDTFTSEECANYIANSGYHCQSQKCSRSTVNGGVKAGHWGGAKTGQFAAWASSTARHGRPGGDGRGFVAGADVAFKRRG